MDMTVMAEHLGKFKDGMEAISGLFQGIPTILMKLATWIDGGMSSAAETTKKIFTEDQIVKPAP
ncbi:hypothetical protein [Corynebacterium silvaticum]|uniref:Uncharacterized protein n=1 Tax=Corynebacterium silvaticum TaxID=2320431 RepID=A0A7Y4LHB9_9CORY|nr:hypothetical protein [Corynebacterium silvaticum]ARU46779.1 hypothetical protein CBE74_10350 [Corynebacterium silvaticum]MBH5300831.1 hypothetical protein [Corynebacterium silvaticum]NOM65028.1 hypothetical protein [Corynebacterium silvaticum]NON70091.1 hypothetical protein [Corynebacterium silvaticum]TFA91813.1 hypothetical protein EU802_08585 [Corynebacterium silvaticum]